MAICNDKASTYLKRLGYNVIRHPRTGILPLQLVGQQRNSVAVLGGLDRLITNPTEALPTLSSNQRAADLNGQASSQLSTAIGLNILGTFIGAMGGNLGIKSKYKLAQRIEFQFKDVLMDSVEPLAVGKYLRYGEVDADNPVLEQYVLGNGRLYLITQTVKTRQFTVKAQRNDGSELTLDIPEIQGVLGGSIGVSADSKSASMVTYEGPEHLVFGFKAFLIGVQDGNLEMVSAEASHVALESTATGALLQGKPAILGDEGFVDLVPEEHLQANM